MSQTLYEISSAYAEVQAAIDADDDADEALSDALDKLTDQLEHKAAGLVHITRDLELNVDKLDAEIARLTARRRTAKAQLDRIKRYIKNGMTAAGLTRIKAGTFSICVYDGQECVVVDDESKIPDAYMRIKKEPNKLAIKDAYTTTGECIPGTRMERLVQLRIR